MPPTPGVRRRVVVAVALVAAAAVPGRAEDAPIQRTAEFRKRVDTAIAKGVAWLQKAQAADWANTFEALELDALTYHALRVCKVPADDAAAAKLYAKLANEFDEELKSNKEIDSELGTLEAGTMCLAIADHGTLQPSVDSSGEPSYILDARDKARMQALVKFLERSQQPKGTWLQFVDIPAEAGEIDVTFTYTALLGLKAASRSGVKVQPATWTKALQYFRGQQDPKGEAVPGAPKAASGPPVRARGWSLDTKKGSKDFFPSDWDTANALTSMAICRSELMNAAKGKVAPDAALDLSFRDGLAYLGHDTFIIESLDSKDADTNKDYYFESAFTLERAGDLLGVERMGKLDWYGAGAEAILGREEPSGGWVTNDSPDAHLRRCYGVRATCYALLFLGRGTARVRWSVTGATDDTDIRFDGAAALPAKEFDDLVDFILSRWRRNADPAAKERIFAKATAVGPRIVPSLITRLASEKADDRVAAIALLKRATGLDHGFDPAAEPEARAFAVSHWSAWWLANQATLHFDAKQGLLVP